MIYSIVLAVHVVVSFVLIGVILVQGGRGGMAEAFGGSGAQSLFGGGANVVMTKLTALGAGIFLVTSLTLAKLSTQRGLSVIERLPITLPTDEVPWAGIVPSEAVAPNAQPLADSAPAPAPVELPADDKSSAVPSSPIP